MNKLTCYIQINHSLLLNLQINLKALEHYLLEKPERGVCDTMQKFRNSTRNIRCCQISLEHIDPRLMQKLTKKTNEEFGERHPAWEQTVLESHNHEYDFPYQLLWSGEKVVRKTCFLFVRLFCPT